MADRYQRLTASRPGAFLARRAGLPVPAPLRRWSPGHPAVSGPVELGGDGRMVTRLRETLTAAGAQVRVDAPGAHPTDGADSTGGTGPAEDAPGALVFDATSLTHSARLGELHSFFHPRIRSLAACGRVVVVGTPQEATASAREAVVQRALEGFVRSVGKELKRGGTAQLLLVAPGAEDAWESTLRFLLSAKSAYVSGQVLRLAATHPAGQAPTDRQRPLAGRTALVTGAAQGIGAVVAQTLRRDGALVWCLDVPARSEELRAVADRVGGMAVELDITADNAPELLAARLRAAGPRPDGAAPVAGGVDIVVHNAGVTRDRTLGRMDAGRWDAVLAVNLTAVERLTERLLDPGDPLLRDGGRLVCTSSISGIAGNMGQSNYAASKAGLIGLVQALAPACAERGITANAVAPGFVETAMTAAVPLFIREAGRRMNSLKQGGQPVDVAEAVAYLAAPDSGAVNGQVLRVCGQSLLGA